MSCFEFDRLFTQIKSKTILAKVSICVVYKERSAWFSPRQV